MKTLIITAHPASYGFTHKIADTYKEVSESRGHEVEIIDLYKPELKQDFLTFEELRDVQPSETSVMLQEKITHAQELVFVFPIWWFGPPAIMKNFFDVNFTAGFAFDYDKDGTFHKLLAGKQARLFMTADGNRGLYWIAKWIFMFSYSKIILGYCGIKVKSITIFSEMFKKRDDGAREKLLEQVRTCASR